LSAVKHLLKNKVLAEPKCSASLKTPAEVPTGGGFSPFGKLKRAQPHSRWDALSLYSYGSTDSAAGNFSLILTQLLIIHKSFTTAMSSDRSLTSVYSEALSRYEQLLRKGRSTRHNLRSSSKKLVLQMCSPQSKKQKQRMKTREMQLTGVFIAYPPRSLQKSRGSLGL